jgi:hypothetical protein
MVGLVPTIQVFTTPMADEPARGARALSRTAAKTWMVATGATMTGEDRNLGPAFSRMGEGGAERRMRASPSRRRLQRFRAS